MFWLRGHFIAVFVVALSVAATAVVFTVARPEHRKDVTLAPDQDLPYTEVEFTAADARRAFAAENIALAQRNSSTWITTLGSTGDILTVDTFAEPEQVKAAGFYNYTLVNGQYVRMPSDCAAGNTAAARWRGNIRVIVNCVAAAAESRLWLRRVERALARL